MKLWLWRGLRHRRWQAAALAVSLALSVALLVATVVLAEGVKSGLEISAQRLGADLVLIPRAVQVRQPEALLFGGETVPAYMPASLEAQARQTEGVQAVTAQFFLQTLEKSCCDLDSPKQLIGYDSPTDWVVTSWTKEGAPAIKDDEIVVGAGISAVQTQELAVLGRFFKIRSVLPETGTALDNSLFISLAEARSLANGSPEMQNLWQENGPPSALISALLIRLKPEADVWQVRQALSELGPVQVLAAGEKNRCRKVRWKKTRGTGCRRYDGNFGRRGGSCSGGGVGAVVFAVLQFHPGTAHRMGAVYRPRRFGKTRSGHGLSGGRCSVLGGSGGGRNRWCAFWLLVAGNAASGAKRAGCFAEWAVAAANSGLGSAGNCAGGPCSGGFSCLALRAYQGGNDITCMRSPVCWN